MDADLTSTRRQLAQTCRDLVAQRTTASSQEVGVDPLARRDFLRHTTEVAAEHWVRFTVSSRLVSQFGRLSLAYVGDTYVGNSAGSGYPAA